VRGSTRNCEVFGLPWHTRYNSGTILEPATNNNIENRVRKLGSSLDMVS
jgi:hypothetical protein